jgi:hypothetical protein
MEKIKDIIKKLEKEGYEVDPDNELLKIEIGQQARIKLLDINSFERAGKEKFRYTVLNLDTGEEQTLFGSAHLDFLLSKKDIEDEFILMRIEDKDVGKGFPMKQYKTLSKKTK